MITFHSVVTKANKIRSACLPTLRLLLVRLFPILGGSTARSRNKYYNYGSGNELGKISQGRSQGRSHHTHTDVSAARSAVFDKGGDGITVKTSYTVQRTTGADTDEASLVSYEGRLSR